MYLLYEKWILIINIIVKNSGIKALEMFKKNKYSTVMNWKTDGVRGVALADKREIWYWKY